MRECRVSCQALESEIVAHEPLMEAVTNMAHHMVAKKHPAVHDIESKLSSLLADLKQLKELTAERKLKLTDAVESQTVCSFLHSLLWLLSINDIFDDLSSNN